MSLYSGWYDFWHFIPCFMTCLLRCRWRSGTWAGYYSLCWLVMVCTHSCIMNTKAGTHGYSICYTASFYYLVSNWVTKSNIDSNEQSQLIWAVGGTTVLWCVKHYNTLFYCSAAIPFHLLPLVSITTLEYEMVMMLENLCHWHYTETIVMVLCYIRFDISLCLF